MLIINNNNNNTKVYIAHVVKRRLYVEDESEAHLHQRLYQVFPLLYMQL